MTITGNPAWKRARLVPTLKPGKDPTLPTLVSTHRSVRNVSQAVQPATYTETKILLQILLSEDKQNKLFGPYNVQTA